jgi:tetratricopeptide (TPR) repeat protein
LGQHAAAITDYDKAIQLKPNYAYAYSNRGLAKVSLGQHAAAITDYDKAIQLKPDVVETYNNRGMRSETLDNTLPLLLILTKHFDSNPIMLMPIAIADLRR